MSPRTETLIRHLALRPHPEGGFYREVHRSQRRVQPFDARASRNALTLIHFLLVDGGASRWHRVASDEAWTWVEGAPLELFRLDAALSLHERIVLAAPAEGVVPAAVIGAGSGRRRGPPASTRSSPAPSRRASTSPTSR